MTGNAMPAGGGGEPQWVSKFEGRSSRVKGCSLHPTRPWVILSLHDGSVQAWDYRLGVRVNVFSQQDGPVRSVTFHLKQPLFASAGDDFMVRVWNYRIHRCIVTFSGHSDYVRSVEFHTTNPWVLSASDDQTARIWNWQSRSCVAVIAGHTHFVMAATFCPLESMIATCSLDQTIRLWDTSGLIKKHSRSQSSSISSAGEERSNDFFGPLDVVPRYLLDGHDRSVACISFHPSKPLLASGSDDRSVRIWKWNENKAWEVEVLRGHTNNVSSVTFHAKNDWVISVAEDKSVRVWDLAKQACLLVHRFDSDRLWCVSAHPLDCNLFGCGHDAGFTVFRLDTERPVTWCDRNSSAVYLVLRDRPIIRQFSPQSQQSKDLGVVSFTPQSIFAIANRVIVCVAKSGDSQVFLGPLFKAGKRFSCTIVPITDALSLKYQRGTQTISIASTDESFEKSISVSVTIKTILPLQTGDKFLIVGTCGKLLLAELAGTDSLSTIAESSIAEYVDSVTSALISPVFSDNSQLISIACKKALLIFDASSLSLLFKHSESVPIGSLFWRGSDGVLFFSGEGFVKFFLRNGEVGTIRSVSFGFHLITVLPGKLIGLDSISAGSPVSLPFNESELVLKNALLLDDKEAVEKCVAECDLVGQSVIDYLRKHGYPEVALSFLKDAPSRFELSLEAGDLESAAEAAQHLNSERIWLRLANEALQLGDVSVAESSLLETNNFSKALRLCAILGASSDRFSKISSSCFSSGRVTEAFLGNCYSCKSKENIRLLQSAQMQSLAYLIAKREEMLTEHQDLVPTFPVDELFLVEKAKSKSSSIEDSFSNWPVTIPEKRFTFKKRESPVMEQLVETLEDNQLASDSQSEDENGWNQEVAEFDSIHSEYSFEDACEESFDLLAAIKDDSPLLDNFLKQRYQITNRSPLQSLINSFISRDSLFSLSDLESNLQSAHSLTTAGKFQEAKRQYLQILYSTIFVDHNTDTSGIFKESLEYIVALTIELRRKELLSSPDQVGLSCELAVLFTKCSLRQDHLILAMRSAISFLFKHKQFFTCASLATRLLELNVESSIATQIEKILSTCQRDRTDSIPISDLSDSKKKTFCSQSLRYTSSVGLVCCCFCKSVGESSYQRQICNICSLSEMR